MRRDYKILIIDEDEQRRQDLKVIMDFMGEPAVASSLTDFQKDVSESKELLVTIVGVKKPSSFDSKFISKLQKWAPNVPLLFIGDENVDKDASEQLHKSMVGTIQEPFTHSQVQDALHRCQIAQEYNRDVDNQGKNRSVILFRSLVGSSESIKNIRHMMKQVMNSDATVLILGESGTGKEVVARNLHYHSDRRDKPFIAVNCGAIPADLLESELFGHEKGAFTGAIATRKGRFEMAEGGTLFLDEIGDMPQPMQVKLLRVLQERTIERVGGKKSIKIDVRIISATHHDLEQEIKEGHFREDLFYRLNLFPIRMPPLRDRMDDITLLINELISRIESQGRPSIHLLPEAIEAMSGYSWPGNIRELANMIERLVILYPNKEVKASDLPRKFQQAETKTGAKATHDGLDLKEYLAKTEKTLIQETLKEHNNDVTATAEYLHIRETTLLEKMKKHGLKG